MHLRKSSRRYSIAFETFDRLYDTAVLIFVRKRDSISSVRFIHLERMVAVGTNALPNRAMDGFGKCCRACIFALKTYEEYKFYTRHPRAVRRVATRMLSVSILIRTIFSPLFLTIYI